jgi:hypothetical protein
MVTTTEITEKYIREHTSIKYCLKKNLINYSALARLIGDKQNVKKTTSKEAILIAARRYRDKINDINDDKDIIDLFESSNFEIKNNIVVFTLEKNIYPDSLIDIERVIKKDKSLFYSIEGTKTITIIVQKHYTKLLRTKFKNYLLSVKNKQSLITITSPGIADIPGAVHHITGLFFENKINIEEFMSCYDDTLIVIDSKDVPRIVTVLGF